MSDIDAVRAVINLYFDALFESDADKVHAAFHPSAKIVGYSANGEFNERDVATFATFVASHQPSAAAKGDPRVLEIVSAEVAGQTAVTLVRDDYLGLCYLDTLSFVQCDGRWCIYNKLFHIEGPALGSRAPACTSNDGDLES